MQFLGFLFLFLALMLLGTSTLLAMIAMCGFAYFFTRR